MVNSLIITSEVMSAEDINYSTIENKYKDDTGTTNKCLRTFSNNNSVSIGNCTADGSASDSTSMRQWQVVEQSNGFFIKKQIQTRC